MSELEHLEDLEDEIIASICSVKGTPDWLQSSKEGILQALKHQHDHSVTKSSAHERRSK